MVIRMGSETKSFEDFVCPRCYKALRRNRILVPLLSFLIFVGYIFIAIYASTVWKIVGGFLIVASIFIFALDSHFTTEILGLILKPLLGPYKVRFMGEDPLMSRAKKDEYQMINRLSGNLIEYASKEYSITISDACQLLWHKGDFMAKIHADASLLTLPTDQLFKRLFSEKDVIDYLNSLQVKYP